MKNLILFLNILFVVMPVWARAQNLPPAPPKTDCQSAKEFVTAKEYLDSRKELSLDMGQVLEVSHDVSKGCTGAAKRFIRAFAVLERVELGTRNALRLALNLAKRDDGYTDTFLGVFQRAYLKEHMDLDLETSVRLAQALSIDYQGDVKKALKDFTELTKYCLNEEKLGLSLPACADLAGTVAKAGENHKKPMAPAFQKLYEFLIQEDGLKLPVAQAAQLAKNMVTISPDVTDNVKTAYSYASDKLGYPAAQALEFAQLIGQRTSQEWAGRPLLDFTRLPASQVTTPESKP